MTTDEIYSFIDWMRGAIQNFFVKPEEGTKIWFNILGEYSRKECFAAVEFMMKNSDAAPTPKSIKAYCDTSRKQKRLLEGKKRGSRDFLKAEESFRNIPGATRAHKIMYVCAEEASKRWPTDQKNEFFGDILLKAKEIGVVFEWIDYDKIKMSHNGFSEAFVGMAINAERGNR